MIPCLFVVGATTTTVATTTTPPPSAVREYTTNFLYTGVIGKSLGTR